MHRVKESIIPIIVVTVITVEVITILLMASWEPYVEDQKTDRVDTVYKLLTNIQIEDYVLKYREDIGIDKAIDEIDILIDENNSDYVPDIGERSDEDVKIDYEFIKHNNNHYVEVDIFYVVTFTHSRFNGVAHLVIHRPVEYDIGKIYIRLDVDYNEEGYLLKGRKIIEQVEERSD